jgi:transposase-like protein
MGTSTNTFDASSEAVGRRWSNALRQRYPGQHAAKRIARDFDVTPSTAESWLGGQSPYARHFVKAAALFGPAILFDVLAPGLAAPSEDDTRRALAEVKGELDRLGDRLARLSIEAG